MHAVTQQKVGIRCTKGIHQQMIAVAPSTFEPERNKARGAIARTGGGGPFRTALSTDSYFYVC